MTNNIYLVGGAVRDKLLNLYSNDLDYVIFGFNNLKDLESYLTSLNCKICKVDIDRNLIRVIYPNKGGVDFTLPKNGSTDIQSDLSYRDFTINSMAIEVDNDLNPIGNTIIDPYLGLQDLNDKNIRFTGKSLDRVKEDPLRILRALRFAITKDFTIDNMGINTTDNIIRETNLFDKKIPLDRIFTELNKMLIVSNTKTFKILQDYNQLYLLDMVKLIASGK